MSLPTPPPARHVRQGAYESAYYVLGEEGGRPLVLCHGLAANGLQFVADARFFADQGFKVIVPDLRGHGRSRCPARRSGQDFTIERLARDLVAILDQEKVERTDWVGNSLGGILALWIMGNSPARINRFVSFGTAYSLSVSQLMARAGVGLYHLLGADLLARIGAPLTSRNRQARRIIRAMLCQMDVEAVAAIALHLARYDLTAAALAFERPILLIRAELDRQVNRALGKTLAVMGKRANFSLVSIRDAGHCANLDQPEEMRRIISTFLD